MLTRRELLIGIAGAGTTTLAWPETQAWASASQPSTPVNFDVPKAACDSHTHIFGDPARFPFASSRVYTPEQASIPEMRALHKALHTERVVIVNPSVYGTDNSCSLDAIRQLGPGARGVAVIDEKTPNSALDEMYRGGMRAIRINLKNSRAVRPGARSPEFPNRDRTSQKQQVARATLHTAIRD